MSGATTTAQPEPGWVELHERCERWGYSFSTSRGWWMNGPLAVYVGGAAKQSTSWYPECDCGEVDESDAPSCCSFHQGGLGKFVQCDQDQCAHSVYVPRDRKRKWDMRRVLAEVEQAPRGPVEIGWTVIKAGQGHVPVVRDGVARFTVKAQFMDAATRFGFPTDWQMADLDQGPCLLGYQGENLVVLLMAESRRP